MKIKTSFLIFFSEKICNLQNQKTCYFKVLCSVFTLTFDEKRKLQNFQAAIGDAQKELDNLKSGICSNSEFIAKLNSKVELLGKVVLLLNFCWFFISIMIKKFHNFIANSSSPNRDILYGKPRFFPEYFPVRFLPVFLELESVNSQMLSKRTSRQTSSRNHDNIFRQSSFEQMISNFGNVEVDDGGIWAG